MKTLGDRGGWTWLVAPAVAVAVAAPPASAEDAQAAAKRRQIAQQAQQMQQFFQAPLQAELELVRRTCGSLPIEARRVIAAAGEEAVKAAATQLAERQLSGQGRQGFDARQSIHEAVTGAVKPHAVPEEFAAYQREHAARAVRRARTARVMIVNKLDQQLDLSGDQRRAVEADLAKHWEDAWLRELDDTGMIVNNYRPAPDFADTCIAPHLDERQRAEWAHWCEQAGWTRHQHQRPWHHDGQTLQPDPWWTP